VHYCDFSRWGPSAILDLFGAYLNHPRRELWVSITLQNLVMIDAVVLIIWTFQYLAHLAWKCLLAYPKLGYWAIWRWPPWAAISTKAKKGTPLHESASIEPSNVKIWWVVLPEGELLKKGINKNFGLYFTYLPRRISTKFYTAVEVVYVITCDKYFGHWLRNVVLWGGLKMEGSNWLSHWLLTLCWRDCAASDIMTYVFQVVTWI